MHSILGIATRVRDPVTIGKSDADHHTTYVAIKATKVVLARKARVDPRDSTEDTMRSLHPLRRYRQDHSASRAKGV